MQEVLIDLISIFSNISIVLASIGLIIATSSFISGLQLVKAASRIEGRIHKYNGIATITIYAVLFILSIVNHGFRFWPVIGWLSGLSIVLLKLKIVRGRKKRARKYISWMGACLVLIWLYIVYIHIPL